MPAVTREAISLPTEVSSEIIQKTQEQSAVMQLARQIQLPGRGVTIPVILGDPEAGWVKEGEKKPSSEAKIETKVMQAYKLAVIETFSEEFTRDAAALYQQLVNRLPLALAKKFDQTVFGGTTAPGENFDTFKSVTAQAIGLNAYDGLVAADADIAEHDGIMDGIVLAPAGKSVLLSSKDTTGRPLFINSVAEGAVPMVLGVKTLPSKGAFVSGNPNIVGFAGDWTQAMYGTVEGVKIALSDQATVDGVSLWEHNMVAIRAEIEIGFRADTSVFNKLTDGDGERM